MESWGESRNVEANRLCCNKGVNVTQDDQEEAWCKQSPSTLPTALLRLPIAAHMVLQQRVSEQRVSLHTICMQLVGTTGLR